MRKIIYAYMTGMAVLSGSCSDVGDSERFVYVKPADVARCVLLEDYTGQLCVNCPNAVTVIDRIHEVYGDNVVAVGIHGGNLALSGSVSPLGLCTAEGDEYYRSAGSPAQPSGRVNRTGSPVTVDRWQPLVAREIGKTAPVLLGLSADYDETSRTVSVTVEALGIDGVDGKLQLWLVEDNIVAPQRMPDGSYNLEYVHDHVFRASVNGTWGEDFSLVGGAWKTVSRTATLDAVWKPEDVSVVAFVYDGDGVQQVARVPVTEVSVGVSGQRADRIVPK